MLKRIKGTNFQTHGNVDIRFHPQVTVITGASEAGKSAIGRIIRWITRNKPAGNSVVKKGTTFTNGKLIFDNGVIEKIRDKNSTSYIVNGTTLKAIGKDIPEEVSAVANVDDRNFQTQHNPYFLLVKSPGEIAKELNELAGISVIDKLFYAINSEMRKSKSELLSLEDSIPEIEDKIAKLEGIYDLEATVDKFEKLLARRKRKLNTIENIDKFIDDLQQIANEKEINNRKLQHGEAIELLKSKVKKLESKNKKYNTVLDTIAALQEVSDSIEKGKENIKRLAKQKEEVMQDMEECPVCGTILSKGEKHEIHNRHNR